MNSFWESSWEEIDAGRIEEYISKFDMEPDSIIDFLLSKHVKTVCDAGCGCGVYTRKLAVNGFQVSGFDIASHAVEIASKMFAGTSIKAELKIANVLSTGYPSNHFDCVISRDVIDHMGKTDAVSAIRELYRITRLGGILIFTLDALDREYEEEPHVVTADGDLLFTSGKWHGMIFHPYTEMEIQQMIPSGAEFRIENSNGELTVILTKKSA